MKSSAFDTASIESMLAPRWKIRLAKIFGRRAVFETDGGVITMYTWRGHTYVTEWVTIR